MLLWLPEDDWPDWLTVPEQVEVEVWRGGQPVPHSVSDVEFYVPEYLGSAAVIEVAQRMSSLRVLQSLSAGYEHLVGKTPEAAVVCNARGVHEASTAELAVGLTIAALRGFPEFVRAQDQSHWVHQRHQALADKRVMILGYGSVGHAVADRLRGFEVEVVPVARNARDGVHAVTELSQLLAEVDVVVVTVPLTASTKQLVDGQFLAAMRDGGLLVNVARGQVVDTNALVAELRSGRLHAALDVTDPEPLPADHPLWQAPNVLISPHVGGDTTAFAPRARRLVQAQLDRFVAGEPLLNVIPRAALTTAPAP
ncbi:MAG TPA: 2-hydroxyacid dehydrogenase [Actinomycetes bacterium]|nr:2-hydroxyacid dehydrogenase [Actinomycetes bacterium]